MDHSVILVSIFFFFLGSSRLSSLEKEFYNPNSEQSSNFSISLANT